MFCARCQVRTRCTRCRSLLLRRGAVRDWMVSSPLGVAPMITRPSPLAAPPPNEHSLFRRRVYRNFKSHRDCHSYSQIWAYRLYRLYQLYHAHICANISYKPINYHIPTRTNPSGSKSPSETIDEQSTALYLPR